MPIWDLPRSLAFLFRCPCYPAFLISFAGFAFSFAYIWVSLCRTGNGRDEIIASEEEIAKLETEKEKKKMEEEKRVEEREIEPESEQVGPAVETEEEDKQITAKLGETSTGSADLTSKGEKEKEVEDVVGPAVEEDEEKEAEVSQVEIVEEIKESIAGPIEVVNTELVAPTCQGLEAVVEREVVELEKGKVVEVTSPENPEKPPEEQAAEVKSLFCLFNSKLFIILFVVVVLGF